MCIYVLYSVVFLLIFCNIVVCSNHFELFVDVKKSTNKTNEYFLSVALDTIVIAEKFKNFDMTNERLLRMTSYLAPGYLRIGGNLADRLHFSAEDVDSHYDLDLQNILESCAYNGNCAKNFTNFTMTGSQWEDVNKFAVKVGHTILFDLNCLIRNEDGSWNSKNAEELIAFSDKEGFNLHWQLGNEPDAFKHMFNYSVNATQLAKDFSALKTILEKYPRYKKSLLIGPDVTRPKPDHKASMEYLQTFLNNSKHILDAVAWHQYYLNGREATLKDFLNPDTFELLENQIKTVKEIVNKTGFNNTPIWLSETSSAYGGGAPGLSNTFAGSFLWIDKLGLAAKHGLQTVIRQSLFHGYYALIDEHYHPSPDWWISALYKRMVGSEVVSCDINGVSKTVRLYCHCARQTSNATILSSLHRSAITVFGANINSNSARVDIKGFKSHTNVVFAYIFTGEKLESKHVFLNGQKMILSDGGRIPFYKPEIVNYDKDLVMPAHSVVFWVIPVKDVCHTKNENISVVQV